MITGIKSIDHRADTRTLYELEGTTPRCDAQRATRRPVRLWLRHQLPLRPDMV